MLARSKDMSDFDACVSKHSVQQASCANSILQPVALVSTVNRDLAVFLATVALPGRSLAAQRLPQRPST